MLIIALLLLAYAFIIAQFVGAKPRRKPMTFARAEQFKFTLNYYGVRPYERKVVNR